MSSDEISLESIKSAIDVLFPEGAVIELRIPKARDASGRNQGTISGYYNDHKELAKDIKEIANKYTGVYYTLNPVEPSLLSRSCNKSKQNAEVTTQDLQIVRRRWLLLDIDPQRAAGISSSDAEKKIAKEKTIEIFNYLKINGWPRPVFGDSGNGYHLLYRIDLDNNSDNTTLIKNVLVSLAQKFDNEFVKVDKSVFNAARIVKAYGSMARKGEELAEQGRFHRVSKLSDTVGGKECVTVDQLKAVANQAEIKTISKTGGLIVDVHSGSTEITPEQLKAFLDFYEIEIKDEAVEADGRYKFVLDHCFFNEEHAAKDAAVFTGSNGLGYKCFHNSCQDNHWKEFRNEVEGRSGKRFSFKTLSETKERVNDEPEANRLEAEKHLQVKKLSLSTMRKTEWLWENRIPLGLVSVFSGDAGIGKTLMALDLSARLSTGADFVDGSENPNDPCSTLLLSNEDDPETLIGPRYAVAGGDLNRLHLVEGTINKDGELISVNLDQDIKIIEKTILENSDIKLVVIDPLMNYLGKKDGQNAQDVRRVLMPLSRMAQDFNIAIIIIAHNNKLQGVSNALHKIGGSAGIGEVVRMGWMFTANEDKSVTTMSQIKYNLGKFNGIDFTTIGKEITGSPALGEQAKINYIGENKLSADDIVSDSEDFQIKKERKESRREQAIKDLFKDNSRIYISDFQKEVVAKLASSWDTVCRIADKMGVYVNGKDDKGKYWEYKGDWGA
jgi:RecA-family ATPase